MAKKFKTSIFYEVRTPIGVTKRTTIQCCDHVFVKPSEAIQEAKTRHKKDGREYRVVKIRKEVIFCIN